MDIDQETLTIPDTEYDATVSMPSAEFARLCRDLSALGESVAIEVSKEGVRFTCEGDAANGTVLLKADPSGGRHSGGSGSKTKVKTEEEEDARMDEDASEDDGGEKDDEDEDEEETSKKRKRTKSSSEKAPKGKTKKARKGGEDDAEAQGVQILMSQQVTLTFSIKYLLNFAKSSNLCSRVTLSLSNDVPLMVSGDRLSRISNAITGSIRFWSRSHKILLGSQAYRLVRSCGQTQIIAKSVSKHL